MAALPSQEMLTASKLSISASVLQGISEKDSPPQLQNILAPRSSPPTRSADCPLSPQPRRSCHRRNGFHRTRRPRQPGGLTPRPERLGGTELTYPELRLRPQELLAGKLCEATSKRVPTRPGWRQRIFQSSPVPRDPAQHAASGDRRRRRRKPEH